MSHKYSFSFLRTASKGLDALLREAALPPDNDPGVGTAKGTL